MNASSESDMCVIYTQTHTEDTYEFSSIIVKKLIIVLINLH